MAFSPEDYSDWSLRGEGGDAEIFRARQLSLDRLVAVKRLKLTSIGDTNDIHRFEREAKLCANLIHPNLVPIFEYGSQDKFYYLVMEYVHGIDLGKMSDLNSDEKLPLAESVKIHLARQMVEVVDYIHQKGVLHRDLKPENFMVDTTGRIKLLDLGMARFLQQTQSDAYGHTLRGTLAYLPPELLRGQGSKGQVSEYYSLALVLLELFQGSRFYRGMSSEEVVSLIQSGIPLNDKTNVPHQVLALLGPYLSLNPEFRPHSLESLLLGLKGLQSNSLALVGGKEALQRIIRDEQRLWLWAMVKISEKDRRYDEALSAVRELMETDPEDTKALEKFLEIGALVNQQENLIQENGRSENSPQGINPKSDPLIKTKSDSKINDLVMNSDSKEKSGLRLKSRLIQIATSITIILVAFVGTVAALKHFNRKGDLGHALREKERVQLTEESKAALDTLREDGKGSKSVYSTPTATSNISTSSSVSSPMVSIPSSSPPIAATLNPSAEPSSQIKDSQSSIEPLSEVHKPILQPYGVLIVEALPKNFTLKVNGLEFASAGEIQLPVSKHLLEISDSNHNSIFRDSVTVRGGEPTVFDFNRRVGKR